MERWMGWTRLVCVSLCAAICLLTLAQQLRLSAYNFEEVVHTFSGLTQDLPPGNADIITVFQPTVVRYHLRLLECARIDFPSPTLEQLAEWRERTKLVFSPRSIRFLDDYRNPCWRERQDSANLNLDHNGFFTKLLTNPDSPERQVQPILAIQNEWSEKFYRQGSRQRVRCLPHFYLAGVTKCGTSSLWDELMLHPDIFSGLLWKEPQWWNRRALGMWTGNKTHFSMDDYIGLYDKVAGIMESNTTQDGLHQIVTGDGSPSTLWSIDLWPLFPGNDDVTEPRTLVPDLIRSFTPQAKVVVILRNPVDRLYSHYFHNMRRYGLMGSKTDFHQKATSDTIRLNHCMQQRSTRECLYDTCINGDVDYRKLTLRAGIYHAYVEEWLDRFPKNQLKIVQFEDYIQDKLRVLNEIWEFLGVGVLPVEMSDTIRNQTRIEGHSAAKEQVGDMWKVTREMLRTFYQPFNVKLAQLLDDRRYLWDS